MIKIIKFGFILVFFLLFVIFSNTAIASENKTATSGGSINTFELFWPVVAGKTLDQPYYFLKDFKEKLRGLLIFGNPQKADYNMLLATKRLLEADKLIKDNKTDLAKQTLNLSLGFLTQVETDIKKAKSEKQVLSDNGNEIMNRLSNIQTYVEYSLKTESAYKENLQEILNKIKNIKTLLK